MTNPFIPLAASPPPAPVRLGRRPRVVAPKRESDVLQPSASAGCTSTKGRMLRIARGNQVVGKWSSREVMARLATNDFHPTDSFYDEDVSEWLALSELEAKLAFVPVKTTTVRICYCGTGLPFRVCCGDGANY